MKRILGGVILIVSMLSANKDLCFKILLGVANMDIQYLLRFSQTRKAFNTSELEIHICQWV